MPTQNRWDIFCQVIDNYGDIGVCWRLARQLAAEYRCEVRIWVDDLASLQRISPETDPNAESQRCNEVEIRHWVLPFPETCAADVVIEAFGCELPETYLAAMARSKKKPLWINLEYLSAEPWVEGCHALPSPHPHLPLLKYFFFPGFTQKTGGLLRESDLLLRRDDLQQTPDRLWQLLRLRASEETETTVSLFCYDYAPIHDLLIAWQSSTTPVRCLLPEGKAVAQVAAHFDHPMLVPGTSVRRGNLTVEVIPFLSQEDYDLLLWACDCNFVRGEDSFVRAQWAGKPMVWQIYQQEENAHIIKLDAFLDRYCTGMPSETASIVRDFHHGWNRMGSFNWNDFSSHLAIIEQHARVWSADLASQTDLASNLVIFCKNRV